MTTAKTKLPGRLAVGWYIARTLLQLVLRRPLVGVRAIPRLPDGRIVLVKARGDRGWMLPGGLMDINEKFRTSLTREVLEECGMQVIRFGRLSGVYSEPWRDHRFHSICLVMEVFVRGEPAPQDVHEIEEARIFSFDSLPVDLTKDSREQLDHYLAGELIVD